MPGKPAPVEERFWSKVKKGDGCWEWQAHIPKHGYGQFDWRFECRAHRAAWRLIYGSIPSDMQVLHRCDNKRCVRPDHLFLGTQKDNVQDCSAKGRISCGEHRPNHKLTEDDIRKIRKLYVAGYGGFGCRKLGELFDVKPSYILKIINHTAWRHISCS